MAKHIKLAVIRDNNAEKCPFGLTIPFACKNVGDLVKNMAPIDYLEPDSDEADKNIISKANSRLMTWSLISDPNKAKPCFYAGKLFPFKDKVECNWGDSAPGQSEKRTLTPPPAYSKHFGGISLDGLYSYPLSFLEDYSVGRNLFYGIYSLQGNVSFKEELKKLAEEAYNTSINDKE